GDLAKAEARFDEAIERNPNLVEPQVRKAEISTRRGEFAKAEEAFNRILTQATTGQDKGLAWDALAQLYRATGRFSKAAEMLAKYLEEAKQFLAPKEILIFQ